MLCYQERHGGVPVQRRAVDDVAGGAQAGHHHHLRLPAELHQAGPVREVSAGHTELLVVDVSASIGAETLTIACVETNQ